MFRKPRTTGAVDPVKPSTGRPPSPGAPNRRFERKQSPGKTERVSNGVPSRTSHMQLKAGKSKAKPNGNILNFFQKVEQPKAGRSKSEVKDALVGEKQESLFVVEEVENVNPSSWVRAATRTGFQDQPDLTLVDQDVLEAIATDDPRFNEDATPVKRRRLDFIPRQPSQHSDVTNGLGPRDRSLEIIAGDGFPAQMSDESRNEITQPDPAGSKIGGGCSPVPVSLDRHFMDKEHKSSSPLRVHVKETTQQTEAVPCGINEPKPIHGRGPFIDESDSDDDLHEVAAPPKPDCGPSPKTDGQLDTKSAQDAAEIEDINIGGAGLVQNVQAKIPSLKREATSIYDGPDEFDELDFDEDEYVEGEELIERRLMEEQHRLEMLESGPDEEQGQMWLNTDASEVSQMVSGPANDQACPICATDLSRLTDNETQSHVNGCLDGRPVPLPEKKTEAGISHTGAMPSNQSQRAIRPAKPGQANPFQLGAGTGGASSAFSKLMSSHAEDAAWATAAAAEQAARGKPAFQRTCPFYKILPGLSICVDAFRYGAVEGCQAYFLSHFHSDHYIGLTASWVHGPIFCSRITGNLVKQQLRVDPKYVVDMEFEKKIEVPGTNGVHVTMIPANHCPGSSLFLFEKVIGTGKIPKTQRLLHCGDFRACPTHFRHPLLRPNLLDFYTGKVVGQQKIDVCYLDTTYLNPRYAFPSQEQVIGACADMCVSLDKERLDENDEWEKVKRLRAGAGMAKFVQVHSEESIGEADGDDVDAMKVNTKASKKSRGRLLVVVGTYSIGKERICLGIARALDCKIFAPPGKQRICACLEDPELSARLTSDPLEGQVHMTPLFEIRAETLQDYLNAYKPHFSRVVGFRPSGWNYKPPNSRFVESPAVQTVLQSANWKSTYSMAELIPQRGSTREASCFGVPYSEHSSFRELTMFCCALRIDKIIPTVNVGSAKSREKMKAWFEKWAMEKKKNGLYQIPVDLQDW